jgi:hypothetical protein
VDPDGFKNAVRITGNATFRTEDWSAGFEEATVVIKKNGHPPNYSEYPE